MVVIWAIVAFLAGVSAASIVIVLVLADRRNERYWAFVHRYVFIGRVTKLALAALVAGCGAASAYWALAAELQ
jgi:hypothetical protein